MVLDDRKLARRHRLTAVPLLTLAAALAVSLAMALPAGAAETPPRDLHLVDGHWTAWDPPVPPPGAEVHVIQPGDTLWALAGRFYGDPYLWPQLWEQNRYILDAHWIYPGDPLVVGVQVEEVQDLAELAVTPDEPAPPAETVEEPGDGILTAAEAAGAPVPLGTESDLYCSGYIARPEREFPHAIIGSEYEVQVPGMGLYASYEPGFVERGERFGARTLKVGLMNGDIVYLDGGRAAGLEPGEQFAAVLPEGLVRHPLEGRVIGRFYRHLGRLQVLSVQADTAIAEIVHACDPIPVGSLLEPFVPEPVPLGRVGALRPVNLPPPAARLEEAPVILRGEDEVIAMAQDSLVYIDQGAADDVVPGDFFTIYRVNRPGLPPVVLGELAVLAVHERSSVARILSSRHTVYVGDRLERNPGRP
ncbi:MAG TPA: LysM peptidoglycan-binding domain-containing protein [Thermoanaerobaculia bacterium]|nr:LysM peptidoglycan-binding domain-containing protein [Thermoanaerobaculia bacterium]